jgi:hypothetical protein
MFVLLDQVQQMRSYEAIFGDLDGRRLVCIKRHLISAFWRDGYYFCTYKPNYKNQRPLLERDVDNKKVYPFSYLQVSPMKGRFYYRMFDNQEGLSPPKMRSENPWLGFMVVCCTPMVRTGKWTASFRRKNQNMPTIHVDQWRNCVDIGPGNDVLAALCMAYVFDRYQCQPLITVVGGEKEQYLQPDDQSIESNGDDDDNINAEQRDGQMYFDNVPDEISPNGSQPTTRSYDQPSLYLDNGKYIDNDAPGENRISAYENDNMIDASTENASIVQSNSLAPSTDHDLLTLPTFSHPYPQSEHEDQGVMSSDWLTKSDDDSTPYQPSYDDHNDTANRSTQHRTVDEDELSTPGIV